MVAKVAKKRKNLNATTKVNPPAHINQPVDLSVRETFHLKFPFELHHMDKTEKKICEPMGRSKKSHAGDD